MIETLVNFDHSLFLFLNGMHSDFMDSFMYWVADRFIWIPLYLLIAVFLVKKYGKQGFILILFAAILILISDQTSVFIKNTVERLRPCHNETISFFVHTFKDRCGGKYGFVSSHAANTMALFTYIFLITRNSHKWLTRTLLIWVFLIGYCRIYLGVHFPADIVGGWLVGIGSAFITYIIYRLIFDSPLRYLKK